MKTVHSTNQNEKIIFINQLELWTETFGDCENPAMILIMGSGGQGILWPTEFCRMLAEQGYFVIRYDHRDTGYSSSINFDTHPYTLLDFASDVVGILNYYQFESAHIVGASMGGAIAMLLGAHYADYVKSLTIICSSTDFRPAFDAISGVDTEHVLPRPHPRITEATKKLQESAALSYDEKLEFFVNSAKLNAGSIPVDEVLTREVAVQNIERMKNPESPNNHFKAMMLSHEMQAAAPSKINARTHIIHGDEDPIFPLPHGEALHKAIAGSTFQVIPGFGHTISSRAIFESIVTQIVETASEVDQVKKTNRLMRN